MKYIILIIFLISIYSSFAIVPGWRVDNNIPSGLNGHNAVMLPDGNVLIAGGITNNGSVSGQCYFYDFSSGAIQNFTPLNEPRCFFSLVSVQSDPKTVRIFAIGGYNGNTNNYRSVKSIEYLDYTIGQSNFQWRTAGNLQDGRGDCSSVNDKGGNIVISGGISQQSGAIRSGALLNTTEMLNLGSLNIFKAGNMSKQRAGHLMGVIKDDNGKNQVITSAGEPDKNSITEIFQNLNWTNFANSPKVFHDFPVSLVDIAGIARMFGGRNPAGTPQATCEWYDVKAGWKYSPNMNNPRSNSTVTQIAGVVDQLPIYMVVAGESTNGKTGETEYYSLPNINNPTGVWVQFAPLNVKGSDRIINMTGSNLPIVTGGQNQGNAPIPELEIFQPLRANDLTFSPEEIGRISDSLVLRIKNEWLLPVRVTNFRVDKSAEFFFTGDTSGFVIPSNGERQIFLRFLPNDTGVRRARLLLNIAGLTDTINLQGTGIVSTIALVSKNISFGDVFLGSDSTICFPAIRNNGNDTTYIDSVSVSANSDYIVVSPQGRVTLAPNTEVTICIKFKPSIRNQIFGTASVHIAGRRFPCSLDGRGVLKYINGFGDNSCDTVSYVPGKIYQAVVTLTNPSDRNVQVNSINLIGGSTSLFSVVNAVPFNMAIGSRLDITINFAPLTEGTYKTFVEVLNDGAKDSTIRIPICFVVRSKSAAFVDQAINAGIICTNDTNYQTIYIENPSSFDNITIDSVGVKIPTSTIKILPFTKNNLSPKENTSTRLSFVSSVPGDYNFILVCYSSFGTSEIQFKAKVIPSVSLAFTKTDFSVDRNNKITVPVKLDNLPVGTQISKAEIKLKYDASILHLLNLTSINNQYPLDNANSIIETLSFNERYLKVQWLTPVTTNDVIFGIDFEPLAGSSDVSRVRIERVDTNSFCFAIAEANVNITGICGGKGSLINTKSALVADVVVKPVHNIEVTIDKMNKGNIHHQVVDVLGQVIFDKTDSFDNPGVKHFNIDLSNSSNGVYFYRVSSDDGTIFTTKLLMYE